MRCLSNGILLAIRLRGHNKVRIGYLLVELISAD